MAHFDIFLSHNSRDKPAVERIATKLKRAGLEPWLDIWCLTPGGKWQEELAAGLRASSTCGFFIGPNGVGDWASEELNVALDRAAKEHVFRLFLVLLPDVPEPFDATSLPPFLSTRTWIDLRKGIEESRGFQLLINAIKGVAPGPETPIEARADICPYRGLQTFNEEHVEFFFGRNGDIQRLVERLKATRFFAVLGPSGSGKSSVVRAGLIPRVRAGALPGSGTWAVRLLTPGSHPLTALAAHLLRLFPQDTMQKTLDQMTADSRTLHLAGSLALAERPLNELVMWVIDQFEEVFTLCRDEQERKQFLDNLLYAASIPDGRSMVILTMRADFYSRCAAYPALSALVASQQFLVSPMDLDGLRQAIEEPAWRVGLEFEEGLVATILDDVANEPGALPLLEHALLELWERRRGRMMTLEAYRETGGVHGALAKRADTVYDAFSPEQQEIVRRIMLRLTTPGEGTEDTRRRATITELVTSPDEAEAIESVVRAMADARLLTAGADEQSGERLIDVSHEALIRSWPRLRKWIDEDRAALRLHRRVTDAAQEWQRSHREEGLLFRGARLVQAIEWRERRAGMLNEMERHFLDGSVALRDRENAASEALRRRELEAAQRLAEESKARLQAERERADTAENLAQTQKQSAQRARSNAKIFAVLGLIALGSAVIAVVFFASEQKARLAAERASLLNRAQALAAQSRVEQNQHPERALILAAEAVQTIKRASHNEPIVGPVQQSLRDCLGAMGGVALAGHTKRVRAVSVSADSHWAITGSEDGTARLWDLRADDPAVHPIVLKGHELAVDKVAVSPDSRWVVTITRGGTGRLWDLRSADPTAQPVVLKAEVRDVAISPDNHWIVTTGGDIRLWDLQSANPAGEPIVLQVPEGSVGALAVSSDSHWLVTGGATRNTPGAAGTAWLWDLRHLNPVAQPVALKGHGSTVMTVAVSPDNRWVITGSGDSTARLWDLRSADLAAAAIVLKHEQGINAMAVSADSRWLVTSGNEPLLWDLWSADPAAHPILLKGQKLVLEAVAVSPDNRWVVTGSYDGTTDLWDLRSANPAERPVVLKGNGAPVVVLAVSPDSRWLITGGYDGSARLWDLRSVTPSAQPIVLKHDQGVSAVAISADNHWVVTGSRDGTRLWDLRSTNPAAEAMVFKNDKGVSALAVSPDNRWVVTGSRDGTAQLWDLRSANPAVHPIVLGGHKGEVVVAVSADSRWVATGAEDETVRLWDLRSANPVAQTVVLSEHEGKGRVTGLVMSAGNRWLVTGRLYGTVLLRDLRSTNLAASAVVLKRASHIWAVAVSPDNRWVVAGGLAKTAWLWDLRDGKLAEEPKLLPHDNNIITAAVSPDNHWAVTGSFDYTARLWNLRSADPTTHPIVLKGHEESVLAVAVTSDSSLAVTGSADHTTRLWDLRSSNPAAQPVVLTGNESINAVAVSSDNRWAVTGSSDGAACLWALKIDDLLVLARRTAGRNLTKGEWATLLPGQPYCETFPGLGIPKD